MIIVTGAAGFIGSCLISDLQKLGYDVIGVDDFEREEKKKNFEKNVFTKIQREVFLDWLQKNYSKISFIFHLGARTDTSEFDWKVLEELNLSYSKKIFEACSKYNIPLLYASSAATYGSGEYGYNDNHEIISKLVPLNPYGISKNEFDLWVISQTDSPSFWIGLKFFNVYGPNEYHKGRMASVVFHAYNQIQNNGKLNLFKSHNTEYKHGEQLRDFIYVKDIIKLCLFFMEKKNQFSISGIYNAGTGRARTFADLATSVFSTLDLPTNINYIDIPTDIRDKYQYFTEANLTKLRNIDYNHNFYELEDGISDYIKNYLSKNSGY